MKTLTVFLTAFLFAGCGNTRHSALSQAAREGSTAEVTSALVGATLTEVDDALIGAARNGNRAAIPILISHGADPNQTAGVNSWTPLEHAIHKNQFGAVKTLIESRADINRRNRHGRTALMMAAGYGYSDIVELLLDRGSDPRVSDEDGMTALDSAIIGTADIDRFTVGQCQASTVQTILAKVPDLALDEKLWRRIAAKIKHCPDVETLLSRSRAAATANKLPVPRS